MLSLQVLFLLDKGRKSRVSKRLSRCIFRVSESIGVEEKPVSRLEGELAFGVCLIRSNPEEKPRFCQHLQYLLTASPQEWGRMCRG